ncbi:MAG: excalibur calcium-binding domain-containing protein [Hyphomicrobiales bacterium]|nr:excalibur calcium-binding domain-containing protein [Hyphomicrobiales bacterium]
MARLVGLAPARRGRPGYWSRHDADSDGTACEPWHPRQERSPIAE